MKSLSRQVRGQLVYGSTLLATLASVACTESVDSDAVRTKGIYAKFEALAVGDGATRITADLRVGGDDGTYVNIISGDELVATVDGDENRLSKSGDLYKTSFSVDEAGTDIQVAFLRDEDEDAPNSEATLPAGFTLSMPKTTVERDEVPTVTWSPSGGSATDIEWRVSGDCIFSDSGTTADDGSFTLSSSQIDVKPSDEDETCEITVTVDRVATGSVDSAFGEGGEFKAIQRRNITFISTPPKEVSPDAGTTNTSESEPPTITDAGATDAQVDATTTDGGATAPADAATSDAGSSGETNVDAATDAAVADAAAADAALDAN
jgi:hypothetical protein